MKRALIALATVVSLAVGPAFAKTVHVYGIVANINGSKLVLTDPYGIKRIVKAQTYCLGAGWGEGTVVLSTEDLNFCVSSTLISKATGDTCEIWCF